MLKDFFREDANDIVIQQAPGPKEIIWHNLKHITAKPLRIALGWSLSLCFLALTLVVFYLLNMFKANYVAQSQFDLAKNAIASGRNKQTIAGIIAWSTFVGIILFNKFVMGQVLHYFTHLEHHDQRDD